MSFYRHNIYHVNILDKRQVQEPQRQQSQTTRNNLTEIYCLLCCKGHRLLHGCRVEPSVGVDLILPPHPSGAQPPAQATSPSRCPARLPIGSGVGSPLSQSWLAPQSPTAPNPRTCRTRQLIEAGTPNFSHRAADEPSFPSSI